MTRKIDHIETSDGITYTLSIEGDHQSARGKISATVTARIERDGVRFEAHHLGACSYRNR